MAFMSTPSGGWRKDVFLRVGCIAREKPPDLFSEGLIAILKHPGGGGVHSPCMEKGGTGCRGGNEE